VDRQYVLNASTKAARLLAQVFSITGDEQLKKEAKMSIQFVINQQKEDGSWPYAVNDARSWSDNYHTGYVLDCLDSYMTNTRDESYRDSFNSGLKFYLDHFFEEDGAPKFYHNRTHPIDSTAAAQSLLTLSRFGRIDLAKKVAEWYMNNMISKKGACYFRKHKRYMDRNIFMRWSNAWMLAGFCYLYYRIKETGV
jgi:rhamnogalacturonyl hydrolase YesR